ncbi:MAG: HdeD family acid-resistance protein [Endomicrobiales bacterium]
MVSTTREKEAPGITDEELRRRKAAAQRPHEPKRSITNAALGIVEIAAGIASIIFSFVAGAIVSLFLGAVVLLAGILETINGAVQRSAGHVIVGVLGAIAGIYILANPLTTLAFLSLVIGGYLVVSGALGAYRARKYGGSAAGGLVEIVIGLVVLFSGFSIGFMVGLYLIIRGIMTYNQKQAPLPPQGRTA